MLSTADFLVYTKWMAIATLVGAVVTGLAFLFQWGIRFRLVGITGFMGGLVGGLFALSLAPFSHGFVPGSTKFSLVYDNGGNQLVIAVAPEITESQLTATIQQASDKFFSYGRLGGSSSVLLVRARTIIHPEPGVSQPLFLGEMRHQAVANADAGSEIRLNQANLQILQRSIAKKATNNS